MDKQVTSTPPIPGNGGVLVTCILHCCPPVDWEPAINVDMVNVPDTPNTSRRVFTVTWSAH